MITIQSNIEASSITIFFDNDGIEELIGFLNFIKNKDESLHLTTGNELEEIAFDEGLFVVPHMKLINTDKLRPK